MKLTISFLLTFMLFIQDAKCQTLALNVLKDDQEITTYSSVNFINYANHKRRKMCDATIVGIPCLTVSVGLIVGGFLLEWGAGAKYDRSGLPESERESQYNQDKNTAHVVSAIGVVLGVAGATIMTCGIVKDMQYRHQRKFSIIAPKKNQIGLAYSF